MPRGVYPRKKKTQTPKVVQLLNNTDNPSTKVMRQVASVYMTMLLDREDLEEVVIQHYLEDYRKNPEKLREDINNHRDGIISMLEDYEKEYNAEN